MRSHHPDRDSLTPISLGSYPLWHVPLPRVKKGMGTHPGAIMGAGTEIARVRELEPGEDQRFFSPQLSAQLGGRWGIFFRREEDMRLAIVIDLASAMDYGVPPKRLVALKLGLSLAYQALRQPNEGSVRVVAVGQNTYRSEMIGTLSRLRPCFVRIAEQSARAERGNAISVAIKKTASEEPEHLIIVISDFLMPPDAEEWESFAGAVRTAEREGSEVVVVRVLDQKELGVPFGASVMVDRGHGRGVWTSRDTPRRIAAMQEAMRMRLKESLGDPEDAKFLEVVASDTTLKEKLTSLLKARARLVKRSSASSSLF